jgi:xanthine/CO dehydrogenase XdhC/CoxF family maturation factor
VAAAEEIPVLVADDAWSVALVMTHNYGRDLSYLAALLPLSLPYLGLLGPRNRREKLLADLADAGLALTPEQLENFFSPAGLDLGAEGPDEIGFSIIGEIQAVMNGRLGGSLRSRKGPIHASPPPKIVANAA